MKQTDRYITTTPLKREEVARGSDLYYFATGIKTLENDLNAAEGNINILLTRPDKFANIWWVKVNETITITDAYENVSSLMVVDGILRIDGIATLLDGGGGGSGLGVASMNQVEVDFGATPINEKKFTVIDPNIVSTSKIIAQVAYEAPTGKDLDEVEMDDLQIRCGAGTGQFDMFIRDARMSNLYGNFKINYTYN